LSDPWCDRKKRKLTVIPETTLSILADRFLKGTCDEFMEPGRNRRTFARRMPRQSEQ